MNTCTFKPGDVCVVLHPDESTPYTFHLLSDEGWWYDGKHNLALEPKGTSLLLERAISSVKEGLLDENIISLLKIPMAYEKSARAFLKNLRRVLDTPNPKPYKTADNMSISVGRFLLGLPRRKTLPSQDVIRGAAMLRRLITTEMFLESGSWPESAAKVLKAEQYLLGITEPKSSKKLLHPLSSAHIIMAEEGEVCAVTTWNGEIYFGVFLGMRKKLGYENPLILTPPSIFEAKQANPVVVIPAGSPARTRSVLLDIRTPTIRHDRFGEMVTAALDSQNRLSVLSPPSRLPDSVIDPERVLGIRDLRERRLQIPPVGCILKAKFLGAIHLAETSPERAHSAFVAAATAMRAVEQLLKQ